jgi:hypothetical protein
MVTWVSVFLKSRDAGPRRGDAMKKRLVIVLWVIGLLVVVDSSRADVIYMQVDEKGTVCFTDNPVSPRARVHQDSWEASTPAVMKNLTFGNRPGPRETGRPTSASPSVTAQPQRAMLKEDTAEIINRLTYGNRQFPKDQLLLFYKSMSEIERLQEEQIRIKRSPMEVPKNSTSSKAKGGRRVVSP